MNEPPDTLAPFRDREAGASIEATALGKTHLGHDARLVLRFDLPDNVPVVEAAVQAMLGLAWVAGYGNRAEVEGFDIDVTGGSDEDAVAEAQAEVDRILGEAKKEGVQEWLRQHRGSGSP